MMINHSAAHVNVETGLTYSSIVPRIEVLATRGKYN